MLSGYAENVSLFIRFNRLNEKKPIFTMIMINNWSPTWIFCSLTVRIVCLNESPMGLWMTYVVNPADGQPRCPLHTCDNTHSRNGVFFEPLEEIRSLLGIIGRRYRRTQTAFMRCCWMVGLCSAASEQSVERKMNVPEKEKCIDIA